MKSAWKTCGCGREFYGASGVEGERCQRCALKIPAELTPVIGDGYLCCDCARVGEVGVAIVHVSTSGVGWCGTFCCAGCWKKRNGCCQP